MTDKRWQESRVLVRCLFGLICVVAGCITTDIPNDVAIPRELRMTTLPPYVIEPPDILLITTLKVIPRPPYLIQPLDILHIQATGVRPEKPISGFYTVEPDGRINFGVEYGSVQLSGLKVEEAQNVIRAYLIKTDFKNPQVQVSLAQSRGMQQIQGDHLVRMDGTIGLGVYGSVYLAGMTLDEARKAIEAHLGQFLLKPEIALDVYAYNSKWYYIIADRAGYGQTVVRLPITGRDTVLDAVSQLYGTLSMSSDKNLWLARPNGKDPNDMQLFPINWPALTQGGSPGTNYQLLPGDRLFIQSNPLMVANNRITQFLMPIQRVLGFTLLGTATVETVESTVQLFQGKTSGSSGAGILR